MLIKVCTVFKYVLCETLQGKTLLAKAGLISLGYIHAIIQFVDVMTKILLDDWLQFFSTIHHPTVRSIKKSFGASRSGAPKRSSDIYTAQCSFIIGNSDV